jgi:hypothetical protein
MCSCMHTHTNKRAYTEVSLQVWSLWRLCTVCWKRTPYMQAHTFTHTSTHLCTSTHTHTYTQSFTQACVETQLDTHTHTHTRTHAHTLSGIPLRPGHYGGCVWCAGRVYHRSHTADTAAAAARRGAGQQYRCNDSGSRRKRRRGECKLAR